LTHLRINEVSITAIGSNSSSSSSGEKISICGVRVIEDYRCFRCIQTELGAGQQWSANLTSGATDTKSVKSVSILGDENTNGLEIRIDEQLCAITSNQENKTLQIYHCNYLVGAKISIRTVHSTQLVKLCAIKVLGKTTASCDDKVPDYSPIACQA
jgi:hypothetical protein